jgi:hypothetical protein
MKINLTLGVFLVLFFVSMAVPAQDLLRTNPNYVKARELQVQATQAYEAGDYDKAVEYADESKRLSDLAEAEASQRLLQLRANGWKNQAERRISYAESIGADRRYPDEYGRAKVLNQAARTAYDAGEYQAAIDSAKAVLALLEDIVPK